MTEPTNVDPAREAAVDAALKHQRTRGWGFTYDRERVGEIVDAARAADASTIAELRAQVANANDDTVPLRTLSRALDEIFMLRRLVAYEAGVIKAHLFYKTFPKTRRDMAEKQIDDLRLAARGHVQQVIGGISYLPLDHAFREAGAAATLTRHQWEAERP